MKKKYFFIPSTLAAVLLFTGSASFAALNLPVYRDLDDSELEKSADSSHSEKKPLTGVFQVVIDPLHKTLISAEIPSPVVKINKRMGESFNKDDILIQLNDKVYGRNLHKAQAVLERARVELEAKKQLFHDNVVSLFDLKEAEANVAIAKADLASAQRDFAATVIKAPYDGKIVDLEIEEWELPQAGKPLVEVIYDKKLKAQLLIPASILPKVKIGVPFTIRLNEINKVITAKVSRIGAVIDPSSSTIKIEGEIDNSDGLIRPGMTGTVEFGDEAQKKGN